MSHIDIIVPYVNDQDPNWKADYNYYKEQEIKMGIQKPTNRQAFAAERIRDWDAFKYWFRGIEKNCPWVHKVFLVIQRKSQLPDWLNINHPKLRIVYHHEFIPAELLPTFNTLIIETFYYRIPDLSEFFIVCNDDFYFLNKISSTRFFNNNKIHQGLTRKREHNWTCGNPDWEQIIENNNLFLEKYILQKPTHEFYHYSHLPDGRVKSFEKQFMDKYYDIIYPTLSVSRFRHPKNLLPSLLYIDTMKYTNYGVLDPQVYVNCKYVSINFTTPFHKYKTYDMVCFNDTAKANIHFKVCREKLLTFLQDQFPQPSQYETISYPPQIQKLINVAPAQQALRIKQVFKTKHKHD